MQIILNDTREVVYLNMINDTECEVGKFGVTKIEPYSECGDLGIWFAVYKEDKVWSKVNGKHVMAVTYKI